MHLLALKLITALKAFDSSCRIHNSLFTGKERMAFATKLNFQRFPGGAGSKGVAATANYFGFRIIFGMNFLFHIYSE